ncbi:hypothetical protein P154DRAFT_265865 [Amniculicola lignicola CBS 123094]|uniref:Uncharacterized protein n=1 Tax=Amniculicola lignicola CBS 123094 TaxID=1392246 RepID=A0A6A5WA65_9PLEO|nr:hypothetical protein P154DRAFT_265865 [Amniculicola lignicola CBS 123094]
MSCICSQICCPFASQHPPQGRLTLRNSPMARLLERKIQDAVLVRTVSRWPPFAAPYPAGNDWHCCRALPLQQLRKLKQIAVVCLFPPHCSWFPSSFSNTSPSFSNLECPSHIQGQRFRCIILCRPSGCWSSRCLITLRTGCRTMCCICLTWKIQARPNHHVAFAIR